MSGSAIPAGSAAAEPVATSLPGQTPAAALPTFRETVRVWLRIGLMSFGSPAGQVASMHREVVDGRAWVGERRFLHALKLCILLSGSKAQQIATYLGWLMHGVRGGLAAGVLFILLGASQPDQQGALVTERSVVGGPVRCAA